MDTVDASKGEIEKFHDQTQAETDKTCKQDLLVVTGHWNAKIKNEKEGNTVRQHGFGNKNESGK